MITIEQTESKSAIAGFMAPAGHLPWDKFPDKENPDAVEKWRAEEWAEIDGQQPVAGTIEARLAEKFASTGCPEIIAMDLRCTASFSHYSSEGLKPHINFGQTNLSDREKLMRSRDHERVHVLQYFFNAAAHAIPVNRNTKVVLDPRSVILLNKLMEREAYTVQWLLSERRAGGADTGGAISDKFLRRAVLMASRTLENDSCVNTNQPFIDYYAELALAQYEEEILKRQEAGEEIIYARLGPKQVRAIGNTLGLDLFGPDNEDAEIWMNEAIPVELLKQVFKLENKLGVKIREVPVLEEALARVGQTEESFLKTNLDLAKKEQKIISPPSMSLHQA
ncbi:MAG: hypothetical protein JWO78_871 [Micavibrio sp.]|nr:hypothetical protein [Micavibrio sp.]